MRENTEHNKAREQGGGAGELTAQCSEMSTPSPTAGVGLPLFPVVQPNSQ
jgi:hypothetical protein